MGLELCNIINKSAWLHKRLMTKILERFDLTYAQYLVLKTIQTNAGITAKEILVNLDTDKATLSGILQRLEKHKLIERKADANDRRMQHITLTAKSMTLCDTILDIETSCASELLEGVKAKEARIFFDVYQRIINRQREKIIDQEEKNLERKLKKAV